MIIILYLRTNNIKFSIASYTYTPVYFEKNKITFYNYSITVTTLSFYERTRCNFPNKTRKRIGILRRLCSPEKASSKQHAIHRARKHAFTKCRSRVSWGARILHMGGDELFKVAGRWRRHEGPEDVADSTKVYSPLTSHATLHARHVATTPRDAAAALGDFAEGVG